MILILTDEDDITSRIVMEWIVYFGKTVVCITPKTNITLQKISIDYEKSISFQLIKNNSVTIDIDKIESFWYRRGEITLAKPDIKDLTDIGIRNEINTHLNFETKSILELVYSLFQGKKSLGNIFNRSINKLLVLDFAKNAGLIIPETKIITSKDELIDFRKKHINIITKSIQDSLYFKIDTEYYCNYTETITNDFIANCSETFFPTLIQEQIDKLYELRVFYIDGEMYSMAIFSQNDIQTQVDFRKYNKTYPNRTVPYNLPKNLESKIITFMKSVNLNTGSLDIIVSKKYEYIFLEVNPVGQFGMVSYPCNYYLEKKVAEYLCNN